jgi:hypothetical protein
MSGANIDDLAQFIVQRRNTLDLALRSDLIKLQTQYGSAVLQQAVARADQLIARDKVSVSGQRQRRRDTRMVDREAQALFARKG